MCDLTGAEYKTGEGQSLQINSLKEDGFARFLKTEKVGRGKYLLKEIYEEPLQPQDRKQMGNASVYLKYIELIILKYLSKEYGTKEVFFSRRKLWLLLGMINENYKKLDKNELIKIGRNIITEEDIDDFYFRCNSRLNRILKTALNNLARRGLVTCEEKMVICKFDGKTYNYTIADEYERDLIPEIECEILQEFKCKSVQEIIYKKLSKKFYNKIKEVIDDEYGWKYYFKAYGIIFNHDNIKKSIPRIDITLDDAVNELNRKIVMALNKDAEASYKRRLLQYDNVIEELPYNPTACFKLDYIKKPHDNYITVQEILANELIDISNEISTDAMLDIAWLQEDIDDDTELNELFGTYDGEFEDLDFQVI